jgi:hypothetical protein
MLLRDWVADQVPFGQPPKDADIDPVHILERAAQGAKHNCTYLSVVYLAALVSLPFALAPGDQPMVKTALLVALVGVPLALLASFASRQSHRASAACGGDDRLAFWLWVTALGLYLATGAALLGGAGAMAIVGFVAITAVQNVWQPTLTSRYYCHAETGSAATTLSVQSQAKGLAAAAAAPLLGALVDALARPLGCTAKNAPMEALWPAAAAGALFCLVGLAGNLRVHRRHWPGAAQPPAGGQAQGSA